MKFKDETQDPLRQLIKENIKKDILCGNKRNKKTEISDLLKMNVTTEYVAHAKHYKYSVSDGRYKIYNHKLYKLLLTDPPESMRDDIFEIDGTKYLWMLFEELEVDLNTMQKNDDVIAFVKSKI